MNSPKDGTVTVTGCMDCPVYDGENGTCEITPSEHNPLYTRNVPYEHDCPDWCPLRTRPVVLVIADPKRPPGFCRRVPAPAAGSSS